eukprot:CAMPEP_0182438200 /NCGR_PEP_ID=MMETSP1167-20130531/85590_1 /TAXON_ID=2988 /ORGANISM="Mallomonas Sp, Strain CCMP3275" /LENGTH=332 /DNA_ID=CAMNT_0024631443 /DNA_START=67 /DNA_END=1062 /DNA_ORIENTATION=-
MSDQEEKSVKGSSWRITPRLFIIAAALAGFLTISALTASLPSFDSTKLESSGDIADINGSDTVLLILSSSHIILMVPGLALFYGGITHFKRVSAKFFRSFLSMGTIICLWVFIGFSLSFGDDANGILGNPATFGMFNRVGNLPNKNLAGTIPFSMFAMFQLMFATVTPSIISLSLVPRVNVSAWILFLVIWHLVVYCPLVHITWHPDGILRDWGYLDFAGGLVVQISSGVAALALQIFLGSHKRHPISPTNIRFVMLGAGLQWFGWLGFNAGSALSAGGLACQTFATTNTCAAASMMTWVLLDYFSSRATSAVGACNGVVVGLVTITPACGF